MPSSLIFAGLVVLWLLILVPAVAQHRQEVARPSVAALSGRVLARPQQRRRTLEVDVVHEAGEPRPVATQQTDDRPGVRVPAMRHPALPEEVDERRWERPPARYRPGRGGFDPEAAALAARARYAFRQRVVLGLLVAAVVTAVVTLLISSAMWWLHVSVDLVLVGYLVYRRRQVRVEEAIRERRAARMAGTRRQPAADDPELDEWAQRGRAATPDAAPVHADDAWDEEEAIDGLDGGDPADGVRGTGEPLPAPPRRKVAAGTRAAAATAFDADADAEPSLPRLQPAPPPPLPAGTTLVEADDEDPDLHDLDGPVRPDYRRAAGG